MRTALANPMESLDLSGESVASARKPVQRRLKRALDIAGALVGLTLLAPVFPFVALAIYLTMGRPIRFRQLRAGRHERPFRLVKFRTMRNDRDSSGRLLPDEQRLTPLGRFLRSTSIDELPQLWNVLVGELSLVGPRPLPLRYLPRYTPRQRMRHLLTPGMTGLAQVNGRNELDWESRLALDVKYCETFSLWLDFVILCATVREVFRRTGARDRGTAPEFWGIEGKPENSPASYPFDENEGAGAGA